MVNVFENLGGYKVEFEEDEDKYPPISLTRCDSIEVDDLHPRFVLYLEQKIYDRLKFEGVL